METAEEEARLRDAEDRVTEIFTSIASERFLGLRVPGGFAFEAVAAERRDGRFPEGSEHILVLAMLRLPVVYHARDNRATTVDRENLDALRARIAADAHDAPGRIELSSWELDPTEDPRPHRQPGEPEQYWQVTVAFRVDR